MEPLRLNTQTLWFANDSWQIRYRGTPYGRNTHVWTRESMSISHCLIYTEYSVLGNEGA